MVVLNVPALISWMNEYLHQYEVIQCLIRNHVSKQNKHVSNSRSSHIGIDTDQKEDYKFI